MPSKISHNFSVGLPVHGEYFVDRTQILGSVETLFSLRTGNILITGERRVGKTSLCFKLLELVSGAGNLMSAYMSMEVHFEQPEYFTRAVLLHVIKTAANRFFSKSYADLLLDLSSQPRRRLGGQYGQLLRLFELARRGTGSTGYVYQKEVGATAIAQAKLIESERSDSSLPQLSAFENLLILDEVVDILQKQNIARFVLFVDEANKLTLEANARIIRDNLVLFSAKGMQFCFVTTPEVVAAAPGFLELFQHHVEVGAFDSIDALHNLIGSCCRINGEPARVGDVFDERATEAIWRLSKGLPFRIQQLCQKSLRYAEAAGRDRVRLDDVLDVVDAT